MGLFPAEMVEDVTEGQSRAHEKTDQLGWGSSRVLCPLQNTAFCGKEGSCWVWGLD